MSEERLQKILARAGFGSRRSCETFISAGRVLVNHRKVVLGAKADATKDTIAVDGKIIPKEEKTVYIAMHKPRGILSDMDPDDARSTVRDLINIPGHLFSVGRLDMDSEGLILMTNDGDLANNLTHPRYGHEKEYRVMVFIHPDDEQLATWRRVVVMEDGYRTAPAQVELQESAGKGAWLRIVMREGKKRQIREVGKRIGVPVARIIRMRIGTLLLGNLKPGEWRYLTMAEIATLKMSTSDKTARPKPQARLDGVVRPPRHFKKV